MEIGSDNHPVLLSGGINGVGSEDQRLTKLSPAGEQVWQARLDNSATNILLDHSGNIYVLGKMLSKYGAAGDLLWQFNLQEMDLTPKDFALDAAGNLYVSGHRQDLTTVLLKLNPAGEEVWYRIVTVGVADVLQLPMAVGADGAPYLAGTVRNVEGARLIELVKLSPDTGEEIYSRTYASDGYYTQYLAVSILADDEGSVYLYGHEMGRFWPHNNPVVLKVSSEGDEIWRRKFEPAYRDYPLKAELGPDGNLFVTSSSTLPRSFAVAKYGTDGTLLWSKLFESPMGEAAYLGAWEPLADGGVALTCYYEHPGTTVFDFLLLHYDSEGNEVYREDLGSSDFRMGMNKALAADALGNLYLAGCDSVGADAAGCNLELRKYSMQGDCPVTPVKAQLYLPPFAMQAGEQVRTTADFGDFILTQDTGIRWIWGDESEPSVSYTAFGTARITGEHTYAQAGIYQIGLDFTGSCLQPEDQEGYKQWMVIYDPAAGDVNGTGWLSTAIQSGSFLNEGDRYAFNVKYRNKKDDKPTGQTLLHTGSGVFVSTEIEWLVVRGNQAVWQGEGKLNGKGKYRFIASAADSGGKGANDPHDQLRIRIWDDSSGKVIYDNHSPTSDIYDMSQEKPTIAGGQVVIKRFEHKIAAEQKLAVMKPAPAEELKVYPNPFSEKAILEFTAPAGTYQVALYDARGSFVRELERGENTVAETREAVLDGSGLEKGLYFVRIQTEQGMHTVKILLER